MVPSSVIFIAKFKPWRGLIHGPIVEINHSIVYYCKADLRWSAGYGASAFHHVQSRVRRRENFRRWRNSGDGKYG